MLNYFRAKKGRFLKNFSLEPNPRALRSKRPHLTPMLRAMLGYMETASATSSKMRSASRREMSKGSAKSLKIGRPTQHPRPSTEVMCSPPTFVGTQSYIGDNGQRPFSSIRKDKFLAWSSALPTMKLNAQRRYCSTTASAPAKCAVNAITDSQGGF